jgi:hypothetical protein
LRWDDQLAVLCAEANKMFMRTVQQIVFLILNRVPVTFVTDPELIRPYITVMTRHSLDHKVMARKAKARKCTAEMVKNIQAKVDR